MRKQLKQSTAAKPGDILRRIDAETETIIEQGRKKRIARLEVVMRRLWDDAISGDLAASRSVLRLAETHLVPEQPGTRNYRFVVVPDQPRVVDNSEIKP